ncbi:MAG: hypothetical protein ACI8UO_005071 [Verrucomicrobiales bacterium]|jgi:hypothetical protein
MKKILTILTITATLGLFSGAAQAGTCYSPPKSKKKPVRVVKCAPHVVKTIEISRCKERKMGYDRHGNCINYTEIVVTFKSIFSDGSFTTFTKTFTA